MYHFCVYASARVRACFSFLFMAASFPCLSLFGLTKDYSFLNETNKCFSARMYTCLEFRTDQNLFTRRRMKFTAISTRFMNLDCESPIHEEPEHILTYTQTQTSRRKLHTRVSHSNFWAVISELHCYTS